MLSEDPQAATTSNDPLLLLRNGGGGADGGANGGANGGNGGGGGGDSGASVGSKNQKRNVLLFGSAVTAAAAAAASKQQPTKSTAALRAAARRHQRHTAGAAAAGGGSSQQRTRSSGMVSLLVRTLLVLIVVAAATGIYLSVAHVNRVAIHSNTAKSELLNDFFSQGNRANANAAGNHHEAILAVPIDETKKSTTHHTELNERSNDHSIRKAEPSNAKIRSTTKGDPDARYPPLQCQAFGGPSQETAQEMVYWQGQCVRSVCAVRDFVLFFVVFVLISIVVGSSMFSW